MPLFMSAPFPRWVYLSNHTNRVIFFRGLGDCFILIPSFRVSFWLRKVQGLHEGRLTHALWDKLVFGKIKVRARGVILRGPV